MSLPKRILFGAHDPAGAHAIAPVLLECARKGAALQGLASGPALGVLRGYKLPVEDVTNLSDASLIAKAENFAPELYLAGTSGGLTADKKILLHLRGKVPSVYVLDFWNNYWQRFSGSEKDFAYLPDIVCVMDDLARDEMIAAGIPEMQVCVTGNPYFAHFAEGIEVEGEDPNTILFISQPISDVAKLPGFASYGFDEFDALKGIQVALKKLPAYTLRVHLHPKDAPDKFNSYFDERTLRSEEPALEDALSRAGLIIGIFSPVLMQAAAAGKQVLSFQPGPLREDPLPTNGLGLTRRAGSQEALEAFLRDYAAGGTPGLAPGVAAFLPKDALEKVMRVIETLLPERVL